MSDYQQYNNPANALSQGVHGPQPTRALDRISLAADRVLMAGQTLNEFLDRFHGPTPTVGANVGTDAVPISVSYSSNIERLFANIESLEARLQSLTSIG